MRKTGYNLTDLDVGKTMDIIVEFNPREIGQRNATFKIASDDFDESVYEINLTGIGTLTEVNLIESSNPDADLEISTIDSFGDVYVDGGFVDKTYIIENLGDQELNIGNLELIRVVDNSFEIISLSDSELTQKSGIVLDVGETASFVVRFDPSNTGNTGAVLNFMTNDPNETDYFILLSGAGITAPSINLVNTVNTIDENTEGDELVLGEIELTDDGLRKPTISLSGDDADKFGIKGNILFLIDSPNFETLSSYQVDIQVSDSLFVGNTVTYNLNINDINEAPTDIILDNLSLDENIVGGIIGNLTTVDEDHNDTFTYFVRDDRFEVVNNQLKLKAGELLNFETEPTVNLYITSTDSGNLSMTKSFTVTVNDIDEQPTPIEVGEINLTQKDIALSHNQSHHFGSVNSQGGFITHDFAIENQGQGILSLEQITINGAGETEFTLMQSFTPTQLNQGEVYNFSIKFDPSNVGNFSATLRIINNDDDEGNYVLVLTGEGIAEQKATGSINHDNITGNINGELIHGGDGNDEVDGNEGNDNINGDNGDDILRGGIGGDYLRGGNDNDSLFGEVGNDYLLGDLGNDYLDGGEGSDRLRGGANSDIFVLSGASGTDFILDFNAEEDDFELQGIDLTDLSFQTQGRWALIILEGRTIARVMNHTAESISDYFAHRYLI